MKKTINLLFLFSPILIFLTFIIFEINPLNKFLYIINEITWIFNNINAIEIKYIVFAIIIGVITWAIINISSIFKKMISLNLWIEKNIKAIKIK